MWSTTAACLHIGELVFDDSTYDENGKPCTIKNMDRMNIVGKLLGFADPTQLMIEIVNKPASPGVAKRSPFKKQECNDSRDSLAKSLYDNMFNWLVERMNLTIIPESFDDPSFES